MIQTTISQRRRSFVGNNQVLGDIFVQRRSKDVVHTNCINNVGDILAVLIHLVHVLVESDVFLLIDHEDQLDVSGMPVRVVGPSNRFSRSFMLEEKVQFEYSPTTMRLF